MLTPNGIANKRNNFKLLALNIFLGIALSVLCLAGAAQASMATGSYTGNGNDDRGITGVGFQPDVVIIKASDNAEEAVVRTSSMAGDNTKPLGNKEALTADMIQSLDADGFTIGTDAMVNTTDKTYHWIAFQESSGELDAGSFVGNDADDRSISTMGFQPDYVIVMSAAGIEPVHRSSAQSGDSTLWFKGVAPAANLIQALEASGFQVGSDDNVNLNGVTFHYIAWKAVSGRTAVESYAGNGQDNTDISGVGFMPEYLIIKQDNKKEAVHRSDTVSGDNTLQFIAAASVANQIQALQCDGFQAGASDRANKNNETYFMMAFANKDVEVSASGSQPSTMLIPSTDQYVEENLFSPRRPPAHTP